MKKILVPLDGSDASKNAAMKAVELAKLYDSTITFIMVTQYPTITQYTSFDSELEKSYGSVIHKIKTEESKNMDNLINAIDISSDIKYYKVIASGEPYVEILDYANKGGFDLIVMGRKGYSKVQRFFLGSVTQRVLSEAPCPVLVVRE